MSAAGDAGAADSLAVLTKNRRPVHRLLTHAEQTLAMVTRRMKIRRHLRSVRASALTEAERRQELREAEASRAHARGSDEAATSTASPRAAGDESSSLREAEAERAGVGEAD